MPDEKNNTVVGGKKAAFVGKGSDFVYGSRVARRKNQGGRQEIETGHLIKECEYRQRTLARDFFRIPSRNGSSIR